MFFLLAAYTLFTPALSTHSSQLANQVFSDATIDACYYHAKDRDFKLPWIPYAEVIYATERECKIACWNDPVCGGVVYGYVGGRAGVVCEIYHISGLPEDLQHYPGVNYFEPLRTCGQLPTIPNSIPIDVVVNNPPTVGQSKQRRERHNRLNQQLTFFPGYDIPANYWAIENAKRRARKERMQDLIDRDMLKSE